MLHKNGFSTPLHPYQIASWVIFSWHTLIPILLISDFLPVPSRISFLVTFYTSHSIVFFYGFKATISTPSIKASSEPLYLETNENLNFYCTICKSYVIRSSKHCGICDRCVSGFDHHCKFLNNCIGEENYKCFIMLISSLEVSELILFSFEVLSITKANNHPVLGLLIFDSVLNISVIFLLAYLLGIHVVLKFKGMTTYEYIKASRKKKENKIKPSLGENSQVKENNRNIEVKKSIVRGHNKSGVDNQFSFSAVKGLSEEFAHLTFQVRMDNELYF